MGDHAPLAPSSAARWRQCGRAPSMELAHPEDTESEAAREGTAAHWYLAERLRGLRPPVGAIAENGVPVTAEMMDHVEPLVEAVHQACPGGEVHVEQRVHMTAIHPTDNWGTCDIYLVDQAARTIHVWDFKYGHGYVDHERNWQMIDYAQGVIEAHGLAPGAFSVSMTVYQPRCYHRGPPLRTWTISGAEHAAMVHELHMAAKLVSPNAAAVTGPECKNCRGIVPCQANQRMAGYLADVAMRTVDTSLDPSAMGGEYAMLLTAQERIKARITGLEEAIKANPTGTGWITEQGFGREKWSVPAEEVIALGDMLGVDVRKPSEALTPAQARKKGLDVEVSKAYTTIPKGEVKLVRQSSSAAARAFEQE
jgi:hypothetical protein